MAVISRCLKHISRGRTSVYSHVVEPIGYQETSTYCGNSSCEQPGLIFLTADSVVEYKEGNRIFSFATAVTKVKVKNEPPLPIEEYLLQRTSR